MPLTLQEGPVTTPGLYRLTADAYHHDPCPEPSLSRSIAQELLTKSPRHAWFKHPRLNPTPPENESSRKADIGTLAHTMLIGHGADIVEIQAQDYRTKAAQAMRDEARARGKTPALTCDIQAAREMVAAARQQLAACGMDSLFRLEYGVGEITVAWKDPEFNCWCRCRPDWLPHTDIAIVDYKSTVGSAAPKTVISRLLSEGYDLQWAMAERGLSHLEPSFAGRLDPLIVWQEQQPPYGLSITTFDEELRTVARQKAARAIQMWARCLSERCFPGYPKDVQTLSMPTYALSQWMDRDAVMDGDPLALLAGWKQGKALD